VLMIQLSETTLRDGAQGEGISFSLDDKIKVIYALDDLGIGWKEAGNPGASALDEELFRTMRHQLPLRFSKWMAIGSTSKSELPPQAGPALIKRSEFFRIQ